MTAEPQYNSFRRSVLSGEKRKLLVTGKAPKLARPDKASDALDDVVVPRAESRRGDHRDLDRHRLAAETASVRYGGRTYEVELINLSAGGAMIRCDFAPRLWDMVEIRFGEAPPIEAAVRWLRGDSVGLEFAHETRIDCDPEQRAAILLEVIQRSFPESRVELETIEAPAAPIEQAKEDDLGNRGETRHPLVWKGQIHFAFDSNPVRLRNISAGGALLDVATDYPVGAELMLDLGDAGQLDATVTWAQGDQVGLKFKRPFDIECLAKLRPDLTPYRWERPTFLDAVEDPSPWDDKWIRSSVAELRSELEGFLKR
jgi:hypothetical protein